MVYQTRDRNDPQNLLRATSARSRIDSFIAMDVMTAAAKAEASGRKIVHMEVGQPATPAPAAARDAVRDALDADRMGYALAIGLPALRARIAAFYAEKYGVTVAPERIVVTNGSSAGFVLAFLSLFDAGARLAMPSPGYPCYRQTAKALGVTPVLLETGPEGRWMPDVTHIRDASANGGIDGLLIASPANPTGTMLEPERMRALIAASEDSGAWFISDEIYHGLSYAMTEQTALAYSDQAIVINSFSKYFSMTGWRVGWMVVPQALAPAIEKLTQNLYIAAPTVSQIAALGAFEATEELEANKARYRANRTILLDGLKSIGLGKIVPADGAFYLYIDVSEYTDNSLAFTEAMLDEVGVAATPGLDFDTLYGGQYIRLSYAGTESDMTNGLEALSRWDQLKG